jgi:hypothetical protein
MTKITFSKRKPMAIGERYSSITLAYFSYSTSNVLIMYQIECLDQDDNSFKYKINIIAKINKN